MSLRNSASSRATDIPTRHNRKSQKKIGNLNNLNKLVTNSNLTQDLVDVVLQE